MAVIALNDGDNAGRAQTPSDLRALPVAPDTRVQSGSEVAMADPPHSQSAERFTAQGYCRGGGSTARLSHICNGRADLRIAKAAANSPANQILILH